MIAMMMVVMTMVMMMMTSLTTDGAANLHPGPVRRAGEPGERESHLHCGRLQVCGREDKYIEENKNCECGHDDNYYNSFCQVSYECKYGFMIVGNGTRMCGTEKVLLLLMMVMMMR